VSVALTIAYMILALAIYYYRLKLATGLEEVLYVLLSVGFGRLWIGTITSTTSRKSKRSGMKGDSMAKRSFG
jgi:uncharacterized membrane protein YGL010W